MEPIVLSKARAFAKRVIKAEKYLKTEKREHSMSNQLLRSGTAISALIAEAQYAQSKADFINKMSIALKEANESRNWIILLHDGEYIDDKSYDSIYDDINQLVMMLVSIVRTSKSNS